jgi:GMP synthase-like glutamine amidotransferase
MRIHVLQHVPFEGPARIARWAAERGHALTTSHLYDGDRLPGIDAFERLVVMGGPMGVDDEDVYPWLRAEKACITSAIEAGRSVVGICLGAQLIASALGARVERHRHKEIGWFPVRLTEPGCAAPLLRGLPSEQAVLHWHGDTFELPDGAVHLARSDGCEQQAFLFDDRVLALQFHLESTADSVAALCTHCADEVTPGPFVQGVEPIQAGAGRHLVRCHQTLETLLDRLPV